MRIAMAQINPCLGDFEENSEKILEFSRRAVERRADIVLFPESSLFGYHPMDLLERPGVVVAQMKALNKLIKKLPRDILILFGAFVPNPKKRGKAYLNAAIGVKNGKKVFQCAKTLLPTYDVFDDARHIEAGDMSKNILKYKGKKILITICEDIWAWPRPGKDVESLYPGNPIRNLKSSQVDLILNMSASPFYPGKLKDRTHVVKKTAEYLRAPMAYVNMVGAQDELIYDGGSFAIDKKGKKLSQSVYFQEDLNMVDFEEATGGSREITKDKLEQMRLALSLGIHDFVEKVGMKQVHFGLSGGIDSALVACLAADALGSNRVTAFALPGPYSSKESFSLAEKLASNLGIQFQSIDINSGYTAMVNEIAKSMGEHEFSLMEENMQSRLRGMVLMAYSNRTGSLLLNTSNKAEFATGYGTLYGDMAGGLCPIGDLLKHEVYALAEHYNAEYELIPKEIIERAPTAELAPNQKDEDSLPPYSELDPAVERLVEKMGSARTDTEKFVLNAMLRSEFKRWQAPPILKVSEHSFGRGRRMPVAHRAIY